MIHERINESIYPADNPESAPLEKCLEVLNQRERIIYDLLTTDLRYAEIASKLDLARSTVRTYSTLIANKLGVQGRDGIYGLDRSIRRAAQEREEIEAGLPLGFLQRIEDLETRLSQPPSRFEIDSIWQPSN
jgi:DNA-binding CsgD family transcriptional regulator